MARLAEATGTTSTGEAVQFWVLAVIAVGGALGMVLMRKAVHSALCLAATMMALAVCYMAQGAVFLGVVQIVVYTGAIMMLFLFVVMLVGVTGEDSLKEQLKGQRFAAALCGLGFGVLLIAGIANAKLDHFTGLSEANAEGNVPGLARLIFTRYVWAFEVTGALLITAAIGAMVLTHREHVKAPKTQRELAAQRVVDNIQLPPLPAPGVYARHNAVDVPGLLPDGTIAEDSVMATLRERGQVRDVSQAMLRRMAELENSTADWLGRPSSERPAVKAPRKSLEPVPANGAPLPANGGAVTAKGSANGPANGGPVPANNVKHPADEEGAE
ncbi:MULTISPECIES: NADH-quinone oxidoreductase subunit J [Streptomycetaceae]|uniref:NADH-quinone oxidoreductase subunit J n=1 Tax=Streptomycetaceae TaxID=2062 RepID=UPI0009A24BC3|nr:NADH-quinone oxidoreductase subunit J [Streptomyces sp. CB02056]